MTGSPPEHSRRADWEQEGERIAGELDSTSSALIVGDDPIAAARVALGIGRVQARRRRVAIADVVGELPPIEAFVSDETAHGIVDAFFYGVSLNHVARPIDPARNLYVLPSGAAPIDVDAVLRSERWPRLAGGFHEVGALLLVLAPADAPALPKFATAMDGVVLVGDTALPAGGRELARAELPVAAAPTPVDVEEDTASLASAHLPADSSHREPRVESREQDVSFGPPSRPLFVTGTKTRTPRVLQTVANLGARPLPVWLGVIAAAVVTLGLVTWATRRFLPARQDHPARVVAADGPADTTADSAAVQTASTAMLATDSAPRQAAPSGSANGTAVPPTPAPAPSSLAVANPGDSAAAADWAVAIYDFSSMTFANSQLEQESARSLPAVTWSPMVGADGRHSFLVITGAFRTRAPADALLRDLRARKVLAARQGHVVHAPFALLVQANVAREQVPVFIDGYRLKGLPTYALLQPNGQANVYAGAFESAAQAEPLLATFRASGEQPRVVYRTGRSF
ncbi:MAG TPA: hypothetical protein VF041_06440 [Gemmatimonadaceae bacterium]